MPSTTSRGRDARTPMQIPARGWKDILWRVKDETVADHVSVVSAGVAFFGLLAVFPAVAALISIAGFVLDPADVASRLDAVVALLPQDAASIIRDQVDKVTGGDQTATGLAAVLGFGLALYGSTKGVMTLIESMNIAYDEKEKRGIVTLYATGLALTLFLMLGFILTMSVLVVVPIALAFLGLPDSVSTAVAWLQWPLLALFAVFGLAVVYRFGPSRENARWRWVSPGAIVATVLWLAGTVGFAIYAQNFGSYNETYGTLGGVIVLLTWLWLSAFIVLVGAEFNSEMEHQTLRDSTTGPSQPMGRRGAVKADTSPDGAAGDVTRHSTPRRSSRRDDTDTVRDVLGAVRARPVAAGALALLAMWHLLESGRRS